VANWIWIKVRERCSTYENSKIYAAVAGAVLNLAILIAFIGYSVVVRLSVLAGWTVLAFIVAISADDMFETPARSAAPQETSAGT